jgi:hypothetical protein
MMDGPFGVSCTAGVTTANGILDEPSSVIAGDQILYTDYVLNCMASSFGTLKAGDSITIKDVEGEDIAYTVRTNEAGLDGLTREISLQKT